MFPLDKNTTDGTDKFVTTYYVRDPQGNVMAVYEHKRGESGNGTFTLTEQHLYGASRLGMKKRDLALNVANASESTPVTHYELTNHLGNVMAVISDKASSTNEPTVVSLSDYYPFGMTEPGRSWNAGDYRFGYTGHEKENDLAEGVYTTEYRLLDTRLGRWLSVDPLFGKYPGMGAYNYCGGNPVVMVDPDGKEWVETPDGRIVWRNDVNSSNYSTKLKEGEIFRGATYERYRAWNNSRYKGLVYEQYGSDKRLTYTLLGNEELNIRAFLSVIRYAEGYGDPLGYNSEFGGGTFSSYSEHPFKNKKAKTKWGNTSTAAGAYQFLWWVWRDEFCDDKNRLI